MRSLQNNQKNSLAFNLLPFNLPQGESYGYEWNEKLQGFEIHLANGKLFYAENFFNKKGTSKEQILNYFLENSSNHWQTAPWHEIKAETFNSINFKNIKWQHEKLKMYGKEHYLPRYTAWYGDAHKSYTYAGLKSDPKRWNTGLLRIKKQLEEVTDTKFNSVLLNWYREGKDHMGWHSDDEKELGKNPLIASINFGASRRFLLRRKDNENVKIELLLKHGSLLIMKGELQHFWKHAIPKALKVKEHRINLTFRVIH